MTVPSVLVIEEDEVLAEVLERAFVRSGFSVTTARNGTAALCLPEERNVDVVLLDRDLSSIDGEETARRLRRGCRTYYLPVVLMIPSGDLGSDASVDLLGADGYIGIPTDADLVVEKVRAILDTRGAHDRARDLLYGRINKNIEEMVEDVIRRTFEEKTEEILSELSTGLVDLLERKARDGVQQRLEETMSQEFTSKLSFIIQDATRPVVEEVSNEIVTRISSEILADRSEEMVARLERDELPELSRRVLHEVLETERASVTVAVQEEAKRMVVEDLRANLPALVERMVVKALPRATNEHLAEILSDQVARRVDGALHERGPKLVEEEVLRGLREYARRKMVRLFLLGLGLSVVFLAGFSYLMAKIFPSIVVP